MSKKLTIKSKFQLGQVVATRGVVDYCEAKNFSLFPYIVRHSDCDWGDICAEDKEVNEEALKEGMRLMSVYYLPDRKKIWIITEADRHATTVLFPEEY